MKQKTKEYLIQLGNAIYKVFGPSFPCITWILLIIHWKRKKKVGKEKRKNVVHK